MTLAAHPLRKLSYGVSVSGGLEPAACLGAEAKGKARYDEKAIDYRSSSGCVACCRSSGFLSVQPWHTVILA